MSIRPIQPGELLRLADELAGREGGRGKPQTITLRRAISTAYYALFHKLTQHATDRLLGRGQGWTEDHAFVVRWIAHTDLKALSVAATGDGNVALRRVINADGTGVVDVAQDFLDLQDARHGADYDDSYDVTKRGALSYVDVARRAVDTANGLYAAYDESYARFLGLAVGGVKVAKSR